MIQFKGITAKDLKKKLQNSISGSIALDIDETLSYTNGHWINQMQEHFGNPEKLSTNEMIKKYGFVQNIPHFQNKRAREIIYTFIYSDSFQENIPLIENSNDIAREINGLAGVAAYITARPETVLRGTQKWLKNHNFPDAPILMRPKGVVHEDNNNWKAEVLQSLYPEIKGIVDNDPMLAERLSDRNYSGTHYLYDWAEKLAENIEMRVIPCKSWLDVKKAIRKDYI